MGVLNKDALQGIAAYKYKSGHYTWLDNAMTPFWNWIVEFLPLSIAPNLITLIGTIGVIVSTIILCYYAPHLSEEAPQWVYLLCAFCVFVYQTLDAIDGKQARRTGSSSPLGQLFDHGCDALCTIFTMLAAMASLGVGANWEAFIIFTIVAFCFYLAQWQEYHTGTMSSGNGLYGVTEAQDTLIIIHIITAVLGQNFWRSEIVEGTGISAFNILYVALILSNTVLIVGNFQAIFSAKCSLPADEIGKKSTSRAIAAMQLIPVLALMVGSALWITGPDAADYAQHPCIYLYTIGISMVLISTRMIMCHMCKIPYNLQFRILVPFFLLNMNAYLPLLAENHGITEPFFNPFYASLIFAALVTVIYLHFVVNAVLEICEYLNIRPLTISHDGKKSK